MEKIGLLGFGTMGAAAGRKLLQAGYELVVFDPSEKSAVAAGEAGAEAVSAPALVGARCKIVIMFLPGPAEIAACVGGPGGLLTAMAPGSVIVDHSTVDPTTTLAMLTLSARSQVGYLDAPVLGRPAAVGQWTLPVGGAVAELERCRPVLERYAARVIPVGASGAGNKIKLLNQMMFAAINAMTAEMMAVAERVGIKPHLLVETITASRAATVSNLFMELGKNIVTGNYDNPTFSVELLCKDTRLAVEMARENGAAPLLAQTIQFLNDAARLQGFGHQDTSVMWQSCRNIWTERDHEIS